MDTRFPSLFDKMPCRFNVSSVNDKRFFDYMSFTLRKIPFINECNPVAGVCIITMLLCNITGTPSATRKKGAYLNSIQLMWIIYKLSV